MSRLMLNLHKTADEGIYTTQKTGTNIEYMSNADGTNRVELDTYWSTSHEESPPELPHGPGLGEGSSSWDVVTLGAATPGTESEAIQVESRRGTGVRWGANRTLGTVEERDMG